MEHIVLVDDEPLVLKSLVRLLSRIPCVCDGQTYSLKIITFSNPEQALDYIKSYPISLILSDYRMPGMDGVALLKQCRELQPDVPRLIISGYADLNALVGAINEAEITRFIAKPWNDYELSSTIGQVLRTRQLKLENQRLADVYRIQKNTLSPQAKELKRLEQEEPGLTKVEWGPDGSIILNDE